MYCAVIHRLNHLNLLVELEAKVMTVFFRNLPHFLTACPENVAMFIGKSYVKNYKDGDITEKKGSSLLRSNWNSKADKVWEGSSSKVTHRKS